MASESHGMLLWMMTLALPLAAGMAGMAGSASAAAAAQGGRPEARGNVAILIFDDVQIIDFTAPYEVFGGGFNVYTVARSKQPITTTFGMKVIPAYDFTDAPPMQILVLPGGGRHYPANTGPYAHGLPFSDDPGTITWVRNSAASAELVLSVCNGAFILGRAGLLEGLEATTTASLQQLLQEASPNVRVRSDRRFVDSGRIITAAGLTSGIDASLHVIERLSGRGAAQARALGLEYNWDPSGSWSRAALADRHMRFDFGGFEGAEWTCLSRQGDTVRWENIWSVRMNATAAEILSRVDAAIQGHRTFAPMTARWVRGGAASAPASPGKASSTWTFTDESGRPWNGKAVVEPLAGDESRRQISLSVALDEARGGSPPAAAR